MALKLLIFDFDGLILDTETPEFEILQELYNTYGLTMPLEEWARALGASPGEFDPFNYLATRTDRPVDQQALREEFRQRSLAWIDTQGPMPGVTRLLDSADQARLSLAVASSSPTDWVHGHLVRLGLFDRFHSILTRDDVTHPKPHPELYLRTLDAFGLQPDEAIVFEDSPNGITAARSAGIFTVCVPNQVTRLLDTSQANLIVTSLEELDLDILAERLIYADLE